MTIAFLDSKPHTAGSQPSRAGLSSSALEESEREHLTGDRDHLFSERVRVRVGAAGHLERDLGKRAPAVERRQEMRDQRVDVRSEERRVGKECRL